MSSKIKDNSIFSASEVGQFTYCANSWFLKRKGYRSPPSKKKSHGRCIHQDLGKRTHVYEIINKLSYALLLIGSFFIILFLTYFITSFNG